MARYTPRVNGNSPGSPNRCANPSATSVARYTGLIAKPDSAVFGDVLSTITSV
jgi:hypothetical protein